MVKLERRSKYFMIVSALVAGLAWYYDVFVKEPPPMPTTCLGGVVYYQTYKALAPAYNPDSTVRKCNG